MIATIRVKEGMSQTDVASQLEVSNVTASRIIDRLQEQGWIERRQHPDDRRARCLYLTPAAAPMLDRLSELGTDEERIALTGVSQDERSILDGLLVRIIQNLADTTPDAAEESLDEADAQGL